MSAVLLIMNESIENELLKLYSKGSIGTVKTYTEVGNQFIYKINYLSVLIKKYSRRKYDLLTSYSKLRTSVS